MVDDRLTCHRPIVGLWDSAVASRKHIFSCVMHAKQTSSDHK